MQELIEQLKVILGTNFDLYLKSHNYHWNIEGVNFPQYHSFLQDLYTEVYGSVDTIAELIRTLDSYAPGTLGRLKELTSIQESDDIPDAVTMMSNLQSENNIMRASLMTAYNTANDTGEIGIANFLQDRVQAHEKHAWMLRSILK